MGLKLCGGVFAADNLDCT